MSNNDMFTHALFFYFELYSNFYAKWLNKLSKLNFMSTMTKIILQHRDFYQHLAVFIIVLGLQILAVACKKRNYDLFWKTSLISIWLFPAIFSYFYIYDESFLYIWCLFSIMNSWVIFCSLQKPSNTITIRRTYDWFHISHCIFFAMFVVGFVIREIESSVYELFPYRAVFQALYNSSRNGFYFGFLSYGIGVICHKGMIASLKCDEKNGNPNDQLENKCIACKGDFSELSPLEIDEQQELALADKCVHRFHERCLKSWYLIGGSSKCPYCLNKMPVDQITKSNWFAILDRYIDFLDFFKVAAIWVPITFYTMVVDVWFNDYMEQYNFTTFQARKLF